MNIGGFGALPVAHLNLDDEDDVFDPEFDDIPEGGDVSESVVVHESPGNGALSDPNIIQNKKLETIVKMMFDNQLKIEEMNDELKAGKHVVKELQEKFVQEKETLNQKLLDQSQQLLDQSKKIEILKGKLDESLNLQEEREAWIRDNRYSELYAFFAGATMGSMVTAAVTIPICLAMGSPESTVFKLMGGGALACGQSLSSQTLNMQRNLLEKYENKYMKSHPGASKREAFENAIVEIKLAAQKNTSDEDGWSGISY